MATTHPRGRDRRYSRTIGEPPFAGRRFVENGRVRIEWKEGGRRHRRSFGLNSVETRQRADAELEEILERMQNNADPHDQDAQDQQPPETVQQEQEEQKPLPPLGDVLRDYALAALGVADSIADWVRDAITSPPEWEWVEKEGEDDKVDEDEGGEDTAGQTRE